MCYRSQCKWGWFTRYTVGMDGHLASGCDILNNLCLTSYNESNLTGLLKYIFSMVFCNTFLVSSHTQNAHLCWKAMKKCILHNTLYPPQATEYTRWVGVWSQITGVVAAIEFQCLKSSRMVQWESVRGLARTSSPPSLQLHAPPTLFKRHEPDAWPLITVLCVWERERERMQCVCVDWLCYLSSKC